MSPTPTPEQEKALDAFRTGGSVVIEAGAGTGKTSTLLMLAEVAGRRRGQYVAFNKAIVVEAGGKLPKTVAANTAHSLAMRGAGRRYRHRLGGARMRSEQIARHLDIDPFACMVEDKPRRLAAGFLAGLVMRTITSFCQSDADRPMPRHVPYQDGLDPIDAAGRGWENNLALRDHLMPAVQRAWADLTNAEGVLPYRHDHYLKTWALEEPFIPADFLLVDECQDLNPVLCGIIAKQDHAQRVYVGDSQQSIMGFTGAVNALGMIEADHICYLTQSWRFGPDVAALANRVLADLAAPLRLTGAPHLDTSVGPIASPDAVLCRSNARAMAEVLASQREGRRPHLVGGGTEVAAFARAANDLQEGRRTSHHDLACFESWGEVQDYVDQDPQGGELKLLTGLVDEYGVSTILEALERMPPENLAAVTISTAHKSKGREWDHVRLSSDFPTERFDPETRQAKPLDPAELRLLYVAATRARRGLDVDDCDYLSGKVTPSAAASS